MGTGMGGASGAPSGRRRESAARRLTYPLLGPHSRFGGKLLEIRLRCLFLYVCTAVQLKNGLQQ